MTNNFKALTLSYKNTPVNVREMLALNNKTCHALLLELRNLEGISDLLILSTCNRTEVYYNSPIDYTFSITNALFELKSIDKHLHYQDYFLCLEGKQAVTHLFEVGIGLESQVVGDLQITNQVKKAYQMSADLELAGPLLHRLMHSIFFTNKRIVQETPFRSGAASSSYATVELIEELVLNIASPKVLVIGLGEIGTDVCRNLADSSIEDVTITNRSIEKAALLAQEYDLKVVPFEQLEVYMREADIIISSIAKENFILKEDIEDLDINSFKYFIDLSVPRSISPEVENTTGAIVYNIDKIQNRASEALEKRLASIPQVKAIIHEAVEGFLDWSKEMLVSPTLQKLKQALEDIRLEEVNRFAKKLSDKETAVVEKITRSMMQKIIKIPALQLKAACKRGEANSLIDVLHDLFDLEKEQVSVDKG